MGMEVMGLVDFFCLLDDCMGEGEGEGKVHLVFLPPLDLYKNSHGSYICS